MKLEARMGMAFPVGEAELTATNVDYFLPPYDADRIYWKDFAVYSGTRKYVSLADSEFVAVTVSGGGPGAPGLLGVSAPGHSIVEDQAVTLTGGTLPAEITDGATYYAKDVVAGVSFNLAATPGGAVIYAESYGSGSIFARFNGNRGNPVSDDTKWANAGPANPYAMFDGLSRTQSMNVGSIAYTVAATGRHDVLFFDRMEGVASILVVGTDATAGEVYNRTFDLHDDSLAVTWADWFFEPIRFRSRELIDDLPVGHDDLTWQVTLSGEGPGSTVKCGRAVLASSVPIGEVQRGASFGIDDYSYDRVDQYGGWDTVVRDWAENGECTILAEAHRALALRDVFAAARQTPALWMLSSVHGLAALWAKYRSFNCEIPHPTHAKWTLSLQGMT